MAYFKRKFYELKPREYIKEGMHTFVRCRLGKSTCMNGYMELVAVHKPVRKEFVCGDLLTSGIACRTCYFDSKDSKYKAGIGCDLVLCTKEARFKNDLKNEIRNRDVVFQAVTGVGVTKEEAKRKANELKLNNKLGSVQDENPDQKN